MDKDRIERNRTTSNTNELKYLQLVYMEQTGNKLYFGCFCKSSNKQKFLTAFYNWYDNLK